MSKSAASPRRKFSYIDLDEWRDIFRYDPVSGYFHWKIATKGRYGLINIGDVAGSDYPKGYRIIQYRRTRILAHRLAWGFFYGEEPPEFIDHIDGNPANNRISNLRLATRSENGSNSRAGWGSSGIRGVRFNKREEKWVAYLNVNKQRHHLGYFKTKEAAAEAYKTASKRLRGEFCPF